jgi:2-methylisocitrate lyase-like PEP mutase family enzyme
MPLLGNRNDVGDVMSDHSTRAAAFRALHAGPELLILPNVADAGGARLMESLGARAIATTSSGLAWAHAWPDGDRLPIETHAAAVREIERAVKLPITVDAEGGYAREPAAVAEAVARLMDAGAVGINLEDGSETADATCAKIAAVKAAAARAGVDLFVNTRTDVFLRSLAPGREVEEALGRAKLYVDAGADGLFIPGAADPAAIKAIAGAVPLPLNVMAVPALPPVAELAVLGVRRLSAGGAILQAAWGLTRRLAQGFLRGDAGDLFAGAMGYAELNGVMSR